MNPNKCFETLIVQSIKLSDSKVKGQEQKMLKNLVARAEHDFFGFCPSLSINKGCLQEGCFIVERLIKKINK